jgi:GNAT superfamily N-acetyltransferase
MKTSGFHGCYAPGIASLRSSRLFIHSLLAMLPEEDADVVEDRLAVGDRCLVAWREGCIVGSMWGSKNRASSVWLGRELPLMMNEACLFDAYTMPRCRGLGIAPALSLAWLRVLREEGCAAVIILTLPENVAALRAYAKAGFRIMAIVRSLRLGPWLHDFPVQTIPATIAAGISTACRLSSGGTSH